MIVLRVEWGKIRKWGISERDTIDENILEWSEIVGNDSELNNIVSSALPKTCQHFRAISPLK